MEGEIQQATLTRNDSARFECRWVTLQPQPGSPCIWTAGLDETIYCPVAHGEGKFVARDEATLAAIERAGAGGVALWTALGSALAPLLPTRLPTARCIRGTRTARRPTSPASATRRDGFRADAAPGGPHPAGTASAPPPRRTRPAGTAAVRQRRTLRRHICNTSKQRRQTCYQPTTSLLPFPTP